MIFLEKVAVHALFTKEYARLCDTMQDIDSLLQYFVTKSIISIEDSKEIHSIPTNSNKVKHLLHKIEGPLKSGDTYGFYNMLVIMDEHGVQATKSLATEIKRSLGIQGT